MNIVVSRIWVWGPIALSLIWHGLAFTPATYDVATRGFIEAREYTFTELGTLFFFLAASVVAALIAFLTVRQGALFTTSASFMAFALLAFLIAMEEAQWGQPILNYDIPDAVIETNVQGQMTLHNHESVQGWDGLFYVTFALAAMTLYLPRFPVIPEETWQAIRPDTRLVPIVVLVFVLGAIKTAEALLGNPFEPNQPIRWSSEVAELLIAYWALAYCVLKLFEILQTRRLAKLPARP